MDGKAEREFAEWLVTWDQYMEPDDGIIMGIRKPDDILKVHETLEKIFGE